jgi:hypothetical protein
MGRPIILRLLLARMVKPCPWIGNHQPAFGNNQAAGLNQLIHVSTECFKVLHFLWVWGVRHQNILDA